MSFRLILVAACVAVAWAQTTDEEVSTRNPNIASPKNACPPDVSAFPRAIEIDDPAKNYIAVEHGMQLFLDYVIPCDGFITQFRFLSAETVIWGLHLAVFRPAFISSYRFVGELYLNGFSTNVLGDTWVIAEPSNPLPVKAGDIVGMFYDEFNVSSQRGRASIRSFSLPPPPVESDPTAARSSPAAKSGNTNTLVFTRNGDGMTVNKTLLESSDGQFTYREPALYVVLARFPNSNDLSPEEIDNIIFGRPSSGTTESPISGNARWNAFRDLKCNLLPNFANMRDICKGNLSIRFYYEISEGACKQFVGCDPSVKPGQRPQDYNPNQSEYSWNNNFDTRTQCTRVCRGAKNLIGQRTTTSRISTTEGTTRATPPLRTAAPLSG